LNGNYRNLDIAPQELVSVIIDADDTPRGIVFAEKPFAIREMSWAYDPKQEFLFPTLVTHEITQGFDADTIVIPDVPPTDAEGGGGYNQPPITVPPLPPIPISSALAANVLGTSICGVTSVSVATGTNNAGFTIYWGTWCNSQIRFDDLDILPTVTGSSYVTLDTGKYFVWVDVYGLLTQPSEFGASVIPNADTLTYMKIALNISGTDFSYGVSRFTLINGAQYQNYIILSSNISIGLNLTASRSLSVGGTITVDGTFATSPVYFVPYAFVQVLRLGDSS
jgi:hypothetical protein